MAASMSKRQHASSENLQEHGPCRRFEIEATAALRHDRPDRLSTWVTEVVKSRQIGCLTIHAEGDSDYALTGNFLRHGVLFRATR